MKAAVLFMIGFLVFPGLYTYTQNYMELKMPSDIPVNVTVNDTFGLKFEACHDGGYHWFLDSVDRSKIRLINKTCEPASGKPHQIGGNVIETWTFEALRAGEYTLLFYYKRPWLDRIENTEEVRVIVK